LVDSHVRASGCVPAKRRIGRWFLAPGLLAVVGLSGCATSTHLGRSELSRVAGRTYVIVGASSGIGQGTALRLGELRANVVLAARRTDLLEEVAPRCARAAARRSS
jgi:hypothetical protein